jgi:hypothetical protein
MMVLQYFLYQRGDKAWIKLLVGYLCVSPGSHPRLELIVQSMNWVITIYCQHTVLNMYWDTNASDWIYISYLLVDNFGKWL